MSGEWALFISLSSRFVLPCSDQSTAWFCTEHSIILQRWLYRRHPIVQPKKQCLQSMYSWVMIVSCCSVDRTYADFLSTGVIQGVLDLMWQQLQQLIASVSVEADASIQGRVWSWLIYVHWTDRDFSVYALVSDHIRPSTSGRHSELSQPLIDCLPRYDLLYWK